jgi:NAD(P)-dependent dehydrogenase (short-subunit alcohol dehydrogenase family)
MMLKDKAAVIYGASGGVGTAVAQAFSFITSSRGKTIADDLSHSRKWQMWRRLQHRMRQAL